MSEDNKDNAIIIPIHELPRKNVKVRKTRSGRTRKVELRPTLDDLEYHAQVTRLRSDYVDNHAMVVMNTFKPSGDSTIDTLSQVKYQIAIEAATLEFNRQEFEKRGLDTSQISTRIVNCWKQVAEISLDVKKMGVSVLDPNSEEMQRVFKMWVETFQGITQSMVEEGTMEPQTLDLFFNKFSAAMEGWEGRLG